MSRAVCPDPANALLLWHVSGSLQDAEEAAVLEHLSRCGICAGEVEVLGRLTAALEENADVLEPRTVAQAGETRTAASPTAPRWAWGIAAALTAPALLGLYWLSLGLPMPEPMPSTAPLPSPGPPVTTSAPIVTPEPLRPALQLDLGGGPRRDAASVPTLDLTREAESIVIVFRIPPRSGGRYTVAIETRDGRLVTSPAELSRADAVGRHIYALPADRLRSGGPFDLVLRFIQEAGESTVYRYQFLVETTMPPLEPPG